ncbi:MAG TPA: cupin domain-containing protein [Candidatus Limnocylindria bacterium]|nr:cupin domain-containing protein [Candidatus Limnocylindria bacterium]
MPRLYFASPRDLVTVEPQPGMRRRLVQSDRSTVAVTELDPKTVIETHKHAVEEIGIVTKGSLVMVIAGEQRILTAGDTYRVPENASHGARVLEAPTQVTEIWSPSRADGARATT